MKRLEILCFDFAKDPISGKRLLKVRAVVLPNNDCSSDQLAYEIRSSLFQRSGLYFIGEWRTMFRSNIGDSYCFAEIFYQIS